LPIGCIALDGDKDTCDCFQIGKEFDALLVDVEAPSSTHPVFDIFQKDTFDVSIIMA
jgi:hypothetical protein